MVSELDPITATPTVSIVVVNYRGADDTIACVNGLRDLDWPRESLEIIVVENNSGDGSAEHIRSARAAATVVPQQRRAITSRSSTTTPGPTRAG
jgi:GT2 family glycosyltransferase